MSVLSLRRFSAIEREKYSSSVLRAWMPRHHLRGGTGVRTIALPARVVVVKAWLTVVTSLWSVPAGMPMKTSAAMSSVSSLTEGWNRNRGSLATQSVASTLVATESMCDT